MVAFDTNVVVRLLVRDDAAQAKKAEQTFLRHARGDGVFLPPVVVVETAWVLAYTYELSRKAIHEHLLSLIRTRGVVVHGRAAVNEQGSFLNFFNGAQSYNGAPNPSWYYNGSGQRQYLQFDFIWAFANAKPAKKP